MLWPMVDRGAATRERLMSAAMALFAERGFDGTSVGEIERTAGLAPRSGALYQHFKGGKEDLLRCAIEHELTAIDEFGSVMAMLPLGDLRAEFTLLARWNLGSLERRSELARFVRRDGARLPPELREELYERLVGRPCEQVVSWLEVASRARRAGRTCTLSRSSWSSRSRRITPCDAPSAAPRTVSTTSASSRPGPRRRSPSPGGTASTSAPDRRLREAGIRHAGSPAPHRQRAGGEAHRPAPSAAAPAPTGPWRPEAP
jgi:AcrR family transcriptional regulator